MRLVLLFNNAGELVALVPLLRRWLLEKKVAPIRRLELMGSGEAPEDEIFSSYIGAVVARDYEEAVARKLADMLQAEELGGWDELIMPAMSADDPVVPLLAKELRVRGMKTLVEENLTCPYVALPTTWDGYLAALDGPNRYFVRRTLREFEAWAKPTGWVLRRASTERELEEGWQVLRSVHEDRWKGGGAFQSARFTQFHQSVVRDLLAGKGGKLDLLWLEVGGEPVAAVYNIVYQGYVHCYQSGRKLDVPKHARPGIAIHLFAMQRAIEEGHHTYDFLARPDQYKRQLAPQNRRQRVTLSAVGPSLQAGILSHARREAKVLVQYARKHLIRPKLPVQETGPAGA